MLEAVSKVTLKQRTILRAATIVLLPILTQSTPSPHMEGWISQYAERPTAATIDYRLQHGDVSPVDLLWADVVIATAECGHIGERAIVTIGDSGPLKALVFDCAVRDNSDGTLTWMAENNIIFEVGYYGAEELSMVGKTGIRGTLTWADGVSGG